MALDFQKVPVPVSRGVAGGIDDRILPVGRLLTAQNVQWDKKGRVSSRPGFARHSMAFEDGGTMASPLRLFSNGIELCAICDHTALASRRLYSWSPSASCWLDRGHVSPFCGQQRVTWTDRISFAQADLSEYKHSDSKLVAYVAAGSETKEGSEEAQRYRGVYAGIYDRSGRCVHERQRLAWTVATVGKPHAVHAFGCSDKLLVSYIVMASEDTGDAEIVIHQASNSAPEGGYTLAQSLDDALHEDYNIRTYDAIDLETGLYAVAWCRFAAGDLRVETFNSAHASIVARNMAPPADNEYVRVAICDDIVRDQILMMTVRHHTTTGVHYLEAWGLDRDATLAVNWGPVALDNVANDDLLDNLGCCLWDVATDNVLCVWGNYQTLAAPIAHSGWRTRSRFLTAAAGTPISGTGSIYNCIPYSKPFSDAAWGNTKYPYCIISTHTASKFSYVYEARGCYQIVRTGGTNDPTDYYHCGTWNPGINNSHAGFNTLRLGSCQNTGKAHTHEDKWRFADVVRTDTLYSPYDPGHRYGCTSLEIDFAKNPGMEYVDRGCTAIGGGMVQLYDGNRVDEVCFVYPPIIEDIVLVAGQGFLPGSYYYTTLWETYDHAGNWHRSAPSPEKLGSVGVESAYNRIYTRSLPQTIRRGDGSQVFALTLFRNDASGAARVVSGAEVVTSNSGYGAGATYLNPFIDDSLLAPVGRFLYTDSGELEAVPPMGAALVMVQNERVWLGDMFRPDFVQFSKRYTPGVATTPLVAPEFSEGFGMATPSGRAVTGLGKLDDKVVVFTAREIYAITGRGPNDDGTADDHSGMVLLSDNVGCVNSDSVVSYSNGIFFESADGLWHVDRGLKITPLGEDAEEILGTYGTITDSCVWPERGLVIWSAYASSTNLGALIVYDYETNNWCEWLPKNDNGDQCKPLAVCVHQDALYFSDGSPGGGSGYLYRSSDTVYSDDVSNWIPMVIETAWIQAAGQSGWQRVKNANILLAEVGDHNLVVSVYHDFETAAPQVQTWTSAEINSFPQESVREQVQMRLARQKTQAIKVRVETACGGVFLTAGPTIAGLMLEIGQKKGAAKMPAEQRK